MNIILIEDDELVREAIGYLLMQDGHSVVNTANTSEAIHYNEKSAVDMVLCDISIAMRESDAYTQMWDAFNALEVPVIIIAIDGDEEKSQVVAPPDLDKLLQDLQLREKAKNNGKRPDSIKEITEMSSAIFHEEIVE
jgi:DNA-binding NarL/FixJ family response regulator